MADYLLWLDFETTGLGFDAHILEVAATLTTYDTSPVLTGDWLTIPHSWTSDGRAPWHTGFVTVDDRVQQSAIDLHLTSGLAFDWDNAQDNGELVDPAHVEQVLCTWIDHLVPIGDNSPPTVQLAGSGVERFDRHVIAYQWPDLHRRLHYASYDVSTVRRVLNTLPWCIGLSERLWTIAETADHRARKDIDAALAQARLLHTWDPYHATRNVERGGRGRG